MLRLFAYFCLAASLTVLPAAAQTFRAERLQLGTILEGTWTTQGVEGPLVLSQGAAGALTGTLNGRPCVGQAEGADFTIACNHDSRRLMVLSGRAAETPPVATYRAAGIMARPAAINGRFYLAEPGRPLEQARTAAFTARRN